MNRYIRIAGSQLHGASAALDRAAGQLRGGGQFALRRVAGDEQVDAWIGELISALWQARKVCAHNLSELAAVSTNVDLSFADLDTRLAAAAGE